MAPRPEPALARDAEGIPAVDAPAAGRRLREWRPWPGEKLALAVERPEGAGGETLTIDRSQLALRPGLRATDATLTLALRSSQGGQHFVTLPEGAELTELTLDGVVAATAAGGAARADRARARRARRRARAGASRAASSAWFAGPAVDLGLAVGERARRAARARRDAGCCSWAGRGSARRCCSGPSCCVVAGLADRARARAVDAAAHAPLAAARRRA